MSHSWANSLNGQWYNGYVPQHADYQAIDNSFVNALNGDGGGSWTPTANIQIEGAGFWFAGQTNLNGASVLSGVGLPLVLGDSDYFQYVNGHPAAERYLNTNWQGAVFINGWRHLFYGTTSGLVSLQLGAQAILPLRVHEGATFVFVEVFFRVLNAHSGVPQYMPKFRVCAQDSSGNVIPLASPGLGADTNGFLVIPQPTTGSEWYDSGNVQHIIYTLATGVVIDKSQYNYFLEVQDESGTNAIAGNSWIGVQCFFDNIADNRPS